MCAFGTNAKAECSSEAKHTRLVAATKQAKSDSDSEADGETEWMASQTSEGFITESMQKGLKAVIGAADLDACYNCAVSRESFFAR